MIFIKRTPKVNTNGRAVQNNEGININNAAVAAIDNKNPTP